MPFLPDDYKIPESPSNYFRFQDGANHIRILSSAVVGYEYFNQSKKPVRSKEPFDSRPDDLPLESQIKPFWAFCIWNYSLKMVQIMEITQKTIMSGLKTKIDNRKGKAQDYDFIITKTGKGLDSEYDVDVSEASPMPPDALASYKQKNVDLEALFTGADPFAKSTPLGARNEIIIEAGDMPK